MTPDAKLLSFSIQRRNFLSLQKKALNFQIPILKSSIFCPRKIFFFCEKYKKKKNVISFTFLGAKSVDINFIHPENNIASLDLQNNKRKLDKIRVIFYLYIYTYNENKLCRLDFKSLTLRSGCKINDIPYSSFVDRMKWVINQLEYLTSHFSNF